VTAAPLQACFRYEKLTLLCTRKSRVHDLTDPKQRPATPDRSRPEFFVFRLEVGVMHAAGEAFWSFASAFDKRLVDDHFGADIHR
jgi:hypothetical protein